jgi:hypothetical protein
MFMGGGMIKPEAVRGAGFFLSLILAGCTASAPDKAPVRAVSAVPAPALPPQLNVIGRSAGMLVSQFGKADLDIREGTARKLQFAGPACILDTYLYPPASGREPVVTHVDARLPDGRDMDRASCIAALSLPQAAR